MSADVGIGHQFNIDIRCWIYIELFDPTSQPKFNLISTSYDVVCLFCACWVNTTTAAQGAVQTW